MTESPPHPSGPITTRMGRATDKTAMLAFLADHWRADHIFVQSPDLFDWQYRRADGDYHIALALDDTGNILGFLGYIPTAQFDQGLGYHEIMLAIWKVREDMALPGVGLRLLKLIEKEHQPQIIGAIGISEMVAPIYKAFKYTLDQLYHAALFDTDGSRGEIAQNVPDVAFDQRPPDRFVLADIDPAQFDAIAQGPGLRKSWAYLQNRYVRHPYYTYTIRGICDGPTLKAAVIWRKVTVKERAVLRIVDVIGAADDLGHVINGLRAEVRRAGADYIDILQCGMQRDDLRQAGFVSPQEHADMVLPNFFAPFEARNVTVKLAYRCKPDPTRALTLFRADSDQDRPNLLTELQG